MSPLTRAETSGYTETSLHADVLAFLAGLSHPHLHRTSSPRAHPVHARAVLPRAHPALRVLEPC